MAPPVCRMDPIQLLPHDAADSSRRGALIDECHPIRRMRCPMHFCIGQESTPSVLSLMIRQSDVLMFALSIPRILPGEGSLTPANGRRVLW